MNIVERQLALVKILKENPNCTKAKEELYECTYRFIYGLVLKMCKNDDLIDELVQEGFMSVLVNAIPKFDVNSNVPFLGYACFWITHSVKCYIMDNITPIRMPRNVANLYYRKISGSNEDFSKEKEHISKALNYSFVSTNKNIYENIKFQEVLDDKNDMFKDLIVEDELNSIIKHSSITRRELKALKDSYFNEVTNKDKGEFENCSKQRINQVKKNAIMKLRKSLQDIKTKEHNKQLIMEALYG